ncbi:ASCH domain-containing protein [Citrus sinensis]|uniref:ASCH domain-containing protein n=1 Tax=Citrus sinensis TaxID=2711 RepID=A0ACB8MD03_CITSI|nr:ASCH domain-containing protein [Citrus sinensis]
MEQPSSPGRSPFDYTKCIEEALKFILESHINQTLELDLGLSKDLCSFLLTHNVPLTAGSSDTESQYPFYKRLASVFHESVTSTASCGAFSNIATLNEDDDLKKREDWGKLVLKEGSEMIEAIDINLILFVDGLKTVEGRCAVGDYNRIGSGSLILCNKCLVLKVQDVHGYLSFSEMLQAESLAKVLPGIKTIDEGVQVYRRFYTEEKEKTNGVVAICVTKPAAQPFLCLARILSGLSYGGLQSLLGLTDQTTTITE